MDRPSEPAPVERRTTAARPLPSHRQWTPLGRGLAVVGDNWTLAIVTELAGGRTRLSALRERLAGVSAGVLDRYLQRMSSSGLVKRVRFREMPPRVEVELTDAGRELLPIAEALSLWGLRWSWTEPGEGEILDPGALLRSLPLLLDSPVDLPDGAIELVLEERGGTRRHLAEVRGGAVRMWSEGESEDEPEITATVQGDWRAWSVAFGSAGDVSGLRLRGKRSQAERLLAAITRPQDRPGEAAAPRAESA